MGCRRAGLGFQDSCPGTWGRGGFRDQSGGTAAVNELEGQTGERQKERDLLAGTPPVKPGLSGSKEFPVPEVPGPLPASLSLPPPRPEGQAAPPRKRKWGGARSAAGDSSGHWPFWTQCRGAVVRWLLLCWQEHGVPWALAYFYHCRIPPPHCFGLSRRPPGPSSWTQNISYTLRFVILLCQTTALRVWLSLLEETFTSVWRAAHKLKALNLLLSHIKLNQTINISEECGRMSVRNAWPEHSGELQTSLQENRFKAARL